MWVEGWVGIAGFAPFSSRSGRPECDRQHSVLCLHVFFSRFFYKLPPFGEVSEIFPLPKAELHNEKKKQRSAFFVVFRLKNKRKKDFLQWIKIKMEL